MARTPEPSRQTLGATLAAFAMDIDLASVPEDVRHLAKLHILDTVGCGLAGASATLTAKALRYLAIEHAPGPCEVLGTSHGFGPAAAAFANAMSMNALDFDDGFEVGGRGMGHPGSSLIAAALSGVWTSTVPGTTFLAAVIAAYEINNRVISSMQPSVARFREVYGVCQHQTIGAATAYGHLAGLDAQGMENALGFAATLANVPSLRKYNWDSRPLISLKDFCAPAARSGVQAVQLHRSGFIGSTHVFEGDSGYWRMAGSDHFNAEALVGGLGDEWTLRLNSFKPYPACRWIHTALEGFERIRDAERLEPHEIDGVLVHTSAGLVADFMDPSPEDIVDAQFSLPYTISALAWRLPLAEWYGNKAMAHLQRRAFALRVHSMIDPHIDRIVRDTRVPAGRISVTARGRAFETEMIHIPLGGSARPFSAERVLAKFHANAEPVLGELRAYRLSDALMRIEQAECVASLFQRAG